MCYAHTVLKMALKQAVRWRLVAHNPAADVDPPRAVRPRIEAWDAQEARAFLASAGEDAYSPLWLVALSTGMQLGELRGLRWCDVDLGGGAIQVRRQITRLHRQDDPSDPMSDAGRRAITLPAAAITLPAAAIATLRDQHVRRPVQPVPLDRARRETDPVFARPDGTPLDQDAVISRFKRLVARTGLKRITFHGMRHTHATLLLLAGVNIKTVSERLGHSSVQITLDTYAHVLPQMEQHAAEAIGQLLTPACAACYRRCREPDRGG